MSATGPPPIRLVDYRRLEQQTHKVMPTVSKRVNHAWRKGMDLYAEWFMSRPRTLKPYLQHPSPLPDLPKQLLATYDCVSPAPLEELCPIDFEMRSWDAFKQEVEHWLETQPLDDCKAQPIAPGNFRQVLLSLVFTCGVVHRVSDRALCCAPDVMVSDPKQPNASLRKMCLIGTVAWHLDEKTNLEIEVARLYSCMLLTDCYFGLVSCYTKTFACRRLPGVERCVFVSPPLEIGDALKACAFVAWQGLNFNAQTSSINDAMDRMPERQIPRQQPREFDRLPILARLWKLGKEMEVADLPELVRKLAWWDDLSGLEGIRPEMNLTASGMYQGKSAFVKFKDLSSTMVTDTDSYLRRFVREVDVYARLRKLQGDVIPELLEYGFLRGSTVCFVVMADQRQLPLDSLRGQATASEEELKKVLKSQLREIHALGVHFGGKPLHVFRGRAMFLGMSRGVLGNDRAAMAKDMAYIDL